MYCQKSFCDIQVRDTIWLGDPVVDKLTNSASGRIFTCKNICTNAK